MGIAALSEDLRPIYDLEMAKGNQVERIDEPAGTDCPLAVVFKHPLHVKEIRSELTLPSSVEYWEHYDPHYSVKAEAGYACQKTAHCIIGPAG